jgi:serine/threonine protein kinase
VELFAGKKVDRYTLVEKLGKGGQGTVWKATDPNERSLKAVKIFDLARLPPTAVERARREAKAVRELRDHPAIVPCHMLLEPPGENTLCLVFDLVQGAALSDVLDDKQMTARHRAALLRQIASALAHVHSRGLVHRDIKPANVIVTNDFWADPEKPGHVKLVDFGIVALVQDAKRITAEHHPVGTAPYLAPELLLPARWKLPAETRTQDIFAFGVLAFELLSNSHPIGSFNDSERRTFARAYREADEGQRPWPTTELNDPLFALIRRCLILDPNMRIASGTELAAAMGLDSPPRSLPRPEAPVIARRDATTTPHTPPSDVQAHARPRPASTPIENPPQQAQRSERGKGAQARPLPEKRTLFLAIAGLMALCLVAFVSWQWGRSDGVANGNTTTNAPPAPAPPSQVTTLPMPCCSSNGACKSGWPCGPGNCTAGMPDRWYYLRISGVAGHYPNEEGDPERYSDDYAGSHATAKICVKRTKSSEPAVCSTLKDIAATVDGDRKNRAFVSTADLENGGLEVWVEEANKSVVVRGKTGRPMGNGFLITALCGGLRLYLGPKGESPIKISAYLDPG